MQAIITPDGNRIQLSDMSKKDIELISKISAAKKWSWQTKKYYEISYLLLYSILPAGFYKRLLGLKKDNKINLIIRGLEHLVVPIDEEKIDENIMDENYKFSPKWYQSKSLYLCLKFKRMRIEIATGGGKSFIIAMYTRWLLKYELNKTGKVMIVTIRRMLVDQMIDDIYDYKKDDLCTFQAVYAGAEQLENANVIVGTYQSISKWPEDRFKDIEVFICDEVHMGCVTSIKDEIIPKLPKTCKRFVGFSGTMPESGTIEDLHLEAYFGPIGIQVPAYQLQEEGSIAKIKINSIEIEYGLNLTKPYFFNEDVKKGGPSKLKAEKDFIHTLQCRNNLIFKICEKFIGNQVVLVESVEYAKFLTEYLSNIPDKNVMLIYGGTKNSKRDEIKSKMCDEGDNNILVATYETMSTGVSINNIMAIHFPDGGKSRIRIRQSCGRGLRLHPKKDELQVYDYIDLFKKYWGKKIKDPNGNTLVVNAWPGPNFNAYYKQGKERLKIYEREHFPIKPVKVSFE